MSAPLLQVRNLSIRAHSATRPLLESVSFDLHPGETLGIFGRSGAGKSTLARALLRLLPEHVWHVTGSVVLDAVHLLTASPAQLLQLRGRRISLVGQEPELALNPVLSIGAQLEEVLAAHFSLTRPERRNSAQAALASVGLGEQRFYAAATHQLSGGQRQRAVLALALAADPALLILDEPTSAVDTITQAEVLRLLQQLRAEKQLALLFITHNPALLAGFTRRALLLREGRAAEVNAFEQVAYG